MAQQYDLFSSVIDSDIALVSHIEDGDVHFLLLSDVGHIVHTMDKYDFHLIFKSDDDLYNELLQNQILMTPPVTFPTTKEPQISFEKQFIEERASAIYE